MKFAQRMLSGVVAGMCLMSAMAQPQPPPGGMPNRGASRLRANEERQKETGPAYAQLYTVPEEILAGKAKEWLEAQAKALDGIPLSKRHEERLRDVFSASLAVRVGRLDAGEWGKKLYGEDTVARQVYDALGRIHNGEVAALPVLIDAVPEGEKVGAGWVFMAYGLRTAAEELAVAPDPMSVPILTFAGGSFGFLVSPEIKEEMKNMPQIVRIPVAAQEPIADAILAAKGGPAWQTYCASVQKYLHVFLGSMSSNNRTRPLAKLLVGLCTDPQVKQTYLRELKDVVAEP